MKPFAMLIISIDFIALLNLLNLYRKRANPDKFKENGTETSISAYYPWLKLDLKIAVPKILYEKDDFER